MRAARTLKLAGGAVSLGVAGALSLVAIVGIAGFLLSNEKCGAGGCAGDAVAAEAPVPGIPAAQVIDVTPADPVADKRDQVMSNTFAAVGTEPTPDVQTVVKANRMAAVAEVTERARNGEAPLVMVPTPTGASPHITVVATRQVPISSAAASAADAESGSAGSPGEALAYAPPVVASKLATLPPGQVRIGDSSVNVRGAASPTGKRMFALAAGTPVTVKEQSNGWVHIAVADGRNGWVYSNYLDNYESAPVPASKQVASLDTAADVTPAVAAAAPEKPAAKVVASATRTVGGSGVTVRSGPGKGNGRLFALTAGTQVTVKDNQRGWLKVTDSKGRTGWAYKDYFR